MNRLILGLGNPGEEYRSTRHNVGFRVVEELARRFKARLDRLECNAMTARVELAVAPAGPAVPAAASVLAAVLDSIPASDLAAVPAAEDAAAAADPAAAPGPPGGPVAVLLAQPQTYMNRSGFAARCLLELHGLAPEAVLVVYDEVNLPFGRLRLRRSGSPAGHRGIESILENLRTDQVPRLRIGIAAPGMPPAGGAGGARDAASAGATDDAGTASDLGGSMAHYVLSSFTAAEEEALAPVIQRAADACEVWLHEGIDAAMSRFNGGGTPAAAVQPGRS